MRPRHPSTVLAPVLALTLAACGSGSDSGAEAAASAGGGSYPVRYESCGHDFTVPAPPERVLLGAAPITPTLDALGVRSAAFGYLAGKIFKAPADAGNLQEISPDFVGARETVLGARPDFVLANDETQISGEQGGPNVDDLASAGAQAFVLGGYCQGAAAPATIDVVYSDIRQLGSIFGVPDKATQVEADLKKRVADAAALRGSRPAARVAFVQAAGGKLYALSGGPYGAILSGAGLTNEFADVKENFAEITPEQVLTRRPDAIIAVFDGDVTAQAASADAKKLLSSSPAAQNDAVYAMSGSEIAGGGVNIVAMIEQAARDVYSK